MNLFFEKLTNELKLGNIIEGSSRVADGLTHRMFKICTDKGKYAVKLLNPNIMKRPTAIENFNHAEEIEEILKEKCICAIYSIKFNNKKMQEIDGQYFYVYEWFNGKSLKNEEITKYHCEEMGKLLAKIHNIDLKNEDQIAKEINIDFEYYLNLAKEKKSPIYELIYDKLDVLKNSMNKGNIELHNLPKVKAICHNDLVSKNVLWLNDEYKIIDLECLGYSNPYLELYELALCWSNYESCNINFELFNTFFKSYFDSTDLDVDIDWDCVCSVNKGRLEWLEFNIKRSLMIECDTKEEQEIGIKEVREIIEHIVYHEKVKNEILKNINKIRCDYKF